MEVLLWPGTSAGVAVWDVRHMEACRFANYHREECILHKKPLASPVVEKRVLTWTWEGSGIESGSNSCTVKTKTWYNNKIKRSDHADKNM